MNQALLVIDAQQALIDGDAGEPGVGNKEILLQKINAVIEKAVQENVNIVFVRDTSVAGGEGPGFEVHPAIRRPEGAAFFKKSATSAFYHTSLLDYLKERAIEHLVIAGCQTEYCIDTAVRMATVNGFDVTLVGDAHGTADTPVLSAEQIVKHHNQTLNGYDNDDHFSLVRNSDEALFQPIHERYR
ncbi:cysteine hydrolase family protein [Sporolactobacillus terrae]|uniref:Cysteine hydrolase n=3 Tax=Sporolactobacillus TaxID=2077 RepID=A0A410D5Q1_9BACL|nr:cysteine hydrolase family protein [Sporolactobacillus terrae]QAA21438.1 cysteine hydrolase [Sporolactobacillus terrae]QAA24410.1 cysteine hydrolase [Sporolactobacillus terrae]UAK16236.1 cysteine hydrolase [Sporolactobacillus terrae]BBN97702.1 isochorismatase [Sporolactobacillus terrae]